MSSQDQLEIINAQGEVRFHGLNSARGITNIGRHPDNDIVLDSPVIAPFHAILDHQRKPYRIVALSNDAAVKVSGEVLHPNVPKELRNWDTIELDGCSIVLMEGGPAAGEPAPSIMPMPLPIPIPSAPPLMAPSAMMAATPGVVGGIAPAADSLDSLPDMDELDRLLAMLPEDRQDEYIIVEPIAQNGAIDPSHPDSLDFTVDVEQPATMQVSITNGGPLVGEFIVEVLGIDPTWVSITPASINLMDGQKGNASIAIVAPRLASSRAKAHYFSVVVTSPNYPGRQTSVAGLILIKPFYEYAVGNIDPKKQKIAYSKKVGQALLPIANLGNAVLPIQVAGEDERHVASIEFDSPEEGLKLANRVDLHVPPEETIAVPVFITPRKPRFIGMGGENINYTLTVTPLAGTEQTPRSVLGQAKAQPFMGPLPIVLFGILLLLIALFILTPRIGLFESDKAFVVAGEEATLRWQTSAFTYLKVEPGDGKPVPGPSGSLNVQPLEETAYTLTAETWLASVLPQWFRVTSDPLVIQVTPVLPSIDHFAPNSDEIILGEEVIVSWDVSNADTMNLSVNDANESLPPEQTTGSRTFNLTSDTVFTLRITNAYTGQEGQTKSFTVRVKKPEPIPLPEPNIQQFEVIPQTVVAGEPVTITWVVLNVDSITIDGVEGQFPANGSVTVRPLANQNYVLTASNGEVEKKSSVQVIVLPAPTATPDPLAPKIESFEANPAEVDIGSVAAKNIELSWTISGDVTSVEISGPNGVRYTGLPKKGTLKVATDKAALFVLTAFNGTLRTSQTTQIKVKNPAPKIISISPASSTDVGSSGLILVVNGTGFVKDSKVQLAGSNRTTVFVSDTQLTAAVIAEDLVKAKTFEVKVFTPSPGGGSSGALTFTLNNPPPSLSGISPGSITKGATGLALTVTGANFVNGSLVRWGGADLPTTYISRTQLTAQLTASQLANEGTPAVTVFNPVPGGGVSGAINFTINAKNPVPGINALGGATSGLQPSSAPVGINGQLLIVNGSNFIPGTLMRWKGTFLTTRYISDTQLEADIPVDKLVAVGTANITAFNPEPGGGISDPKVFTVTGLTVTINPVVFLFTVGANDEAEMRVQIDVVQVSDVVVTLTSGNLARLTTHAFNPGCITPLTSATTVTIPAGATIAQFCVQGQIPGFTTLTARLPDPLGGDTDQRAVIVAAQEPTITALVVPTALQGSPGPGVGVGSSGFELVIQGSGFESGAKVNWPGQPDQLAIFDPLSPNQIRLPVPPSFLTASGTRDISVYNPASLTSDPLTFNIYTPSLSSLSPTSATAGSLPADYGAPCPATYNLLLSGDNFVNGSVVLWNGNSRVTTFVSSKQLCAQIQSTDVLNAGTAQVRVRNSVGNQTAQVAFTINAPSIALTPAPSSVNVGSTVVYTVTISPAQNVSRDVNLSASPGANVNILNSTCTLTISQVTITPPADSTTFCVRGVTTSAVVVTADLAAFTGAGTTDTSALTVSAAGTSLTVVKTTPASPDTGQSVTLTATLTSGGGTPVGNVTFSDSLDGTLCSNVFVNVSGQAQCTTTLLKSHNVASHTITASYTPSSGNFSATSNTVAFTVDKADVTTSLSQSAATTVYGQTTTLTATLTAAFGGQLTGSVVFKADGNTIATQSITNLASGSSVVGSFTTALNAQVAAYSLTVEYQDTSTHFNNVTSSGLSHTVNRANTSAVVIKESPAAGIVTGQNPVTFKGTLTATGSSTATVTGTVDFEVNNIVVCNDVTLDSHGDALCTINSATQFQASLTPYSIEVVYSQTTNFNSATGSLSLTVGEATPTITISKIDPAGDPVTGQQFDLRVTLGPQYAGAITPTGNVDFQRWSGSVWFTLSGCNNLLLGSGSWATGEAECYDITGTASSSPSQFRVTYNSDANYIDDTSSTFNVTVNKADVTVSISKTTPAGDPVIGQSVTYSATVSAAAPGAGTPGGTVAVKDGATILCTITLSGGSGTCSEDAPGPAGAHTITGDYSGNTNFNTGSGSFTLTTINPTISITGCPAAATNTNVTLTVNISESQPTTTSIGLSSSQTGFGTVPSSVNIAANTTFNIFTVTRVAAGTTVITATLPSGLGSGTATCSITFN